MIINDSGSCPVKRVPLYVGFELLPSTCSNYHTLSSRLAKRCVVGSVDKSEMLFKPSRFQFLVQKYNVECGTFIGYISLHGTLL